LLCAAALAVGVLLVQAPSGQKATGPPRGGGLHRSSDLVELVKRDPTIRLDIRHATANRLGRELRRDSLRLSQCSLEVEGEGRGCAC
jgi:hypothetical protein